MDKHITPLIFGLGAGTMLLLDPTSGRRRRSACKQRGARAMRDALDFVDVSSRDFKHRFFGTFGEARFRIRGQSVSDDILTRRVGSKLGRLVSHPRAIGVTADNGVVTLTGPVLASECRRLLQAVAAIPGVRELQNELEVHRIPGNIPALQGGRPRQQPRLGFLKEAWTPALRLLTLVTGGTLVVIGAKRRDALGLTLGASGALLSLRAMTNLPLSHMVGLGRSQGIEVKKTLAIDAPIERVFGFFSNFTNFPSFMRYVKDVRDLGRGRSAWVVAGPGGIDVAWDAELTRFEADRLLAWKSDEDSVIEHAGVLRFQPEGSHRTKVTIEMTYSPPAGAIGHVVASLFGNDPQHEIHEDMMRAKTFLETGHPARDAARRRMESGKSSSYEFQGAALH